MSSSATRPRRLAMRVEPLEDRVTPSWGSLPPSALTLPASPVAVTLNASGDAGGTAAITNNEVDWYRFTVAAGAATFSATTPTSNLDTVIGLYNTSGRRVASNDDISYPSNTDSRVSVTLAAGTYYLGVTNYTGTAGGAYTWGVDTTSVAPPSPPPPPPPSGGGFTVALQLSGLTVSQQGVFEQAASRWSQVIIGDIPDATYNGITVDDVLIDASAAAIDGPGGVLGQAGPDRLRSGSSLPIHGTMQFDSADLAQLEANGQLLSTVLHEMGHVLGIGTIWQNRGLVTGLGGADPRFVGVQATAAYNQIFSRTEASVPVENSGGAGTAGGHWRETVFGNEIMTGYLNGGSNPLSRITVGSLADLGYQVNFNAADTYTPQAGAALLSGGGTGGGGAALRSAGDSLVSIAPLSASQQASWNATGTDALMPTAPESVVAEFAAAARQETPAPLAGVVTAPRTPAAVAWADDFHGVAVA